MKLRNGSPFFGRQFAGDTGANIVHELLFEKAACGIGQIPVARIRTFISLKEAKAAGYKPCKDCVWTKK